MAQSLARAPRVPQIPGWITICSEAEPMLVVAMVLAFAAQDRLLLRPLGGRKKDEKPEEK